MGSSLSLFVIIFFATVQLIGAVVSGTQSTKGHIMAEFLSKATFLIWIAWMVINIPIAVPFLLYIASSPVVVQVAFILFLGTFCACFFSYFVFEERKERTLAQIEFLKAVELSRRVQDMLTQAQTRSIDVRECEEAIEKAENLMVIAKGCLEWGDQDARLCAESAQDMYEEAISCLQSLG